MDLLLEERPRARPRDERGDLLASVLREPESRDALVRLGEFADRAGDWRTAEWCWRRLLLIDERVTLAHAGLAAALAGQGRCAAAEGALAGASALLPGEVEIAARFARTAEARADWPEALRRWQAVLLAFGRLPDGYLGLGSAMRAMGRADEARAVLEQGAARFPAEPQLPHDLARLAEERRDWPEAERRWRQALALRQDCPAAAGLARSLLVQGRGSEAAAELARTAVVMSENWSPALRPLMLAVERALEAHARPGGDARLSHVAACFESLGGGGLDANGWAFGCEFGFFQRSAGVEPLGLLRWASIPPDALISALHQRFEGIDDPAQLDLVEHTGSDWGVVHRLWNARFDHSGLDRATVGREAARQRVARSFVLLRRKLLEDLAAAEKIFVYRCHDHVLSDATLDRLVAALGSHGDATLLYVAEAGPGETPLTVERRGPRLLYGRIDRFAPQNHRLVYNDAGWEAVCRIAHRLWREG